MEDFQKPTDPIHILHIHRRNKMKAKKQKNCLWIHHQSRKKLQESNESQEKEESNHETYKSGVIIAASLGAFAIYRIFR